MVGQIAIGSLLGLLIGIMLIAVVQEVSSYIARRRVRKSVDRYLAMIKSITPCDCANCAAKDACENKDESLN